AVLLRHEATTDQKREPQRLEITGGHTVGLALSVFIGLVGVAFDRNATGSGVARPKPAAGHTGGADAWRGVQPFKQPPVEVRELFLLVTAGPRIDAGLQDTLSGETEIQGAQVAQS